MIKKALHKAINFPGKLLVKFLTRPNKDYVRFSVHEADTLAKVIQPGDILLVEGNQWLSGAIKYLTQSTWSHAAICVGNIIAPEESKDDPKILIEADIRSGIVGVPLSKYSSFNTRICRPVNMTSDDKSKVINYVMKHLGDAYDTRNILDLARYLLPTPPIPARFRRRMISLGSGDPTRAICSSLIAQAFQRVKYPIIPSTWPKDKNDARTIYSIRHHSLFTPSDFDLSPYFEIVKPTLATGFDYHSMQWADNTQQFEMLKSQNASDDHQAKGK